MKKKKNKMSLKDLPHNTESFLSKNKLWFSNMFSAFVATVLGIAVTIGVSRCTDYNNNREIIKASVFNALSDLDNYEDFLKKEEKKISQFDWLQEAVDSFYRNNLVHTDSVARKINTSFGFRNHYKENYSPYGKDFLNQCQIRNVEDLETFRIINIAYEDADHSYAFLEEMEKCIDNLNNVWLGMFYSHIRYSSSDVVDKILSHESAHKLCLMMNERFIMDGEKIGFFDYYIKVIESRRNRILLFADTDMKEYRKFKEDRRKKEMQKK